MKNQGFEITNLGFKIVPDSRLKMLNLILKKLGFEINNPGFEIEKFRI